MGLKHMQALNLLRGDAQHQAHGFMALAHLHRHHALLGANRKRAQYQLLHRGRAPRHAHAAGQQIFVLQAAHQPGHEVGIGRREPVRLAERAGIGLPQFGVIAAAALFVVMASSHYVITRQARSATVAGRMDELEEAGEEMDMKFYVGENVKVISGPFSSFTGVVEEVNDERKKLKVMVKIFGRRQLLELSYMQVERE